MLQRHILYVAKTCIICCKGKLYMLQRQNVYVAKQTLYVIKTNLYVAKAKSICCKDKKSTVLGLSAPAGAFFLSNWCFGPILGGAWPAKVSEIIERVIKNRGSRNSSAAAAAASGSGVIKCCSEPPLHTRRWPGWRELEQTPSNDKWI